MHVSSAREQGAHRPIQTSPEAWSVGGLRLQFKRKKLGDSPFLFCSCWQWLPPPRGVGTRGLWGGKLESKALGGGEGGVGVANDPFWLLPSDSGSDHSPTWAST